MLKIVLLECALQMLWLLAPADARLGLIQGYNCTPVSEGDTGVIAFSFSKSISTHATKLFLRVHREGEPDILECHRNDVQLETQCKTQDPSFTSGGLVDDQLALIIPNATQDLQGIYVLSVAFNNTLYDPVNCNFTVLKTEGKRLTPVQVNTNTSALIAGVIVPVCLVLLCVFIILRIKRRKRALRTNSQTELPDSVGVELDNDICEPSKERRENASLLPSAGTGIKDGGIKRTACSNNIGYIHWDMTKEEERELLERNGLGSFLVRRNKHVHNCNVLAVKCENSIQHFMLKKEGSNIVFKATNMYFPSLSDLLEHYKDNKITTTDGDVHCKLTNPCTMDLDNNGYIHWDMTKEEGRELLERNGLGSFFVRRNKHVHNCNVLAVKCENSIEHFMLKKEGSDIVFKATNMYFPSLSDLLEHYKDNKITTTDGDVYCKLTNPCTMDLDNN